MKSSQTTLIPPEGHCQNNKQLGFFKESYQSGTGEGFVCCCVDVSAFCLRYLPATSLCSSSNIQIVLRSVPPFSCFGQIPLAGVSLLSTSSSPPGVTWTPTSTGMDPLPSSSDLALGDMLRPMTPPASPGLENDPSLFPGPLHRRRLCSMKIRISPRGKLVWHWPQVSISCSSGPALRGLGVDGPGDRDLTPESWLDSAVEKERKGIFLILQNSIK